MDIKENIEKWLNFLDPKQLKDNLLVCSLYIAIYESFKDYVIEEVKYFFHTGFDQNGDHFIKDYEKRVLSKDKSKLKATLLWLKDLGAIEEHDIQTFQHILKYRNKLAHEMVELLIDGTGDELNTYFPALINLRIKIEKWWILNIEIPTDPDWDHRKEIRDEEIMTPSMIFNRIISSMLSDDKNEANFYYNELKKMKEEYINT